MAERRRIIEGTWTCRECGNTPIAGRHKICPSCGAAREDGEASFDFGTEDASGRRDTSTVTDDAALNLAAAGKDWFCFYCKASNRGDAERCHTCGAARKEGPPPPAVAPPPPHTKAGPSVTTWIGLAVGVFLVGGIIWWATSTSDAGGEVVGLRWQRTITHERFAEVEKEGWRSDLRESRPRMPTDGAGEDPGVFDIRDCVEEERVEEDCRTKTVDEPCGTEEVCTTKDLGNGFAEEVCKDVPKTCTKRVEECTPAIFDERCTYSTWTWKQLETRQSKGTDGAPHWPEAPTLGPVDRELRGESYEVTVRYGDQQTTTLAPADLESFSRWSMGQPAVVTVNSLGFVVDVQRVSE